MSELYIFICRVHKPVARHSRQDYTDLAGYVLCFKGWTAHGYASGVDLQ